MTPDQIAGFAVVLFLGLIVLSRWLKRRERSLRVKRGLHSYLSGDSQPPSDDCEDEARQNLVAL